MITAIKHIAIAGSGNIATYVGHLFRSAGFTISAVISRNEMTGKHLANELGTVFTQELQVPASTDLLILCVNDDEIGKVSEALIRSGGGNYIICHCAGSLSLDVLSGHRFRGVLYPLQSINKQTISQNIEVPFLVEANDVDIQALLENILKSAGRIFHTVDYRQRLAYHLAAVFANNFTNAMLMATEDLSRNFHIDYGLLKPLIRETFKRLEEHSPEDVQTGPARRNDTSTIERHLELLKDSELSEMYSIITRYIGSKYGK